MEKWIEKIPVFDSDKLIPHLKTSPWEGHRKFVYELLKYMQPENVVELGTHYGCSLFAMCQAIKDNSIDTELYAVDCWEGDEQAGFYGDEVLNLVKEVKENYFPQVKVNLIKDYFVNAVNNFEDGFFDIIHIDGLHTYEAVSEDYNTWIGKLRKNGIVLFHDVHSELGYGTDKFWSEIKELHPYFEFKHSWGLGVLFPKGDLWYKKLKDDNFTDKVYAYQYFAQYNLELIKNRDLTSMVEAKADLLQKTELLVTSKVQENKALLSVSEENHQIVKKMDVMIRERDEALKATGLLLVQKEEENIELLAVSEENHQTVRKMDGMIRERDEALKATELLLVQKEQENKELLTISEENHRAIEKMDAMICERDEALKATEALVVSKEKENKELLTVLEEKHHAIEKMDGMIRERDEYVKELLSVLDSQKEKLNEEETLNSSLRSELSNVLNKVEDLSKRRIIVNLTKKNLLEETNE